MTKLLQRIAVVLFLTTGLQVKELKAQTGFYDLTTIQQIEIFFSQANWDYQMDTAKAGSQGYVMADSVLVNGVAFDSVGVKYKGNSSYDATYIKNPLHISLNEYKSQNYQGVKDIKLSNGYGDPSMIREVLSYEILENYMDCPQSNFAKVYINGSYTGLFSSAENIASKFCNDHFYSSSNTFFKCNPIVTPGPTTKASLRYLNSTDSSLYFNYYELKSATGWNELVQLCDSVSNNPGSLENLMDMDRVIWMLAFNNALVNLDSYTGVFCQNYYLYKDNNSRFNPVVWDLNMCLGGFPYVGSGVSSMGSLTITNMQQLAPTMHATDIYWPLIKAVMGNARWKKMYIAHMRTIVDEFIVSGQYQTMATQLQNLISADVLADANKFFSDANFQNGLTQDVTVGTYQVPGISNLLGARNTYLQGTAEFTAVAPVISNVSSSPSAPVIGDSIWVTATISNLNYVYLGYRNDITRIFEKVTMFDDGLHHDAAAGDGVYGAGIVSNSSITQFYLYAENANAGVFSPVRAEHEFYTVLPIVPVVGYQDVVVNEFMAKNNTTIADPAGEYEDWLELYNNTSSDIHLSNVYASDDYAIPLMWKFPSGTVIPAHGLLSVWLDADTTQSGLHANFKLSAGGAVLMLSTAHGDVIDSLSFGPQSADISLRRCPDGTGAFGYTLTPTYNAYNCPVGIAENGGGNEYTVSPNPANEQVQINSSVPMDRIELVDLKGQVVYAMPCNRVMSQTIYTNQLPSGVYLLRINNTKASQRVVLNH